MKKLYTLLVFAITLSISAQAPQGFNYQATVRNNAGNLIINKSVSFKFNIIPTSASGTASYSETQTVTTDDLGQVSLVIGKGTATTGTFATIDWGTGTYYLGIELNTGNGFVGMGTTQLLSVPYALYAKNAGGALPIGTEKGQILYWNGTAWVTLAPGTDGDILRVTNGVPTFSKTIPKVIIKDHLYSFESDNTIKLNIESALLDSGGDIISKKGIALSTTNKLPTIADDYLTYKDGSDLYNMLYYKDSSFDDLFYYQIEKLQPNTTYYIRTYAENEIGIAYSNLLTLITPSSRQTSISWSKPTFKDINITSSWVKNNFQATNHSIPSDITEAGYIVSKNSNPTIDNSEQYITGLYSSFNYLDNLEPSTTYYIKSFLTNSDGTSYSEESNFTTLPATIPILSAITKPSPNLNSVQLYDSLYDGGSPITQKGFVWSTSPNPTISVNSKKFDTNTNRGSEISVLINGLLPTTTYYVRAFATNNLGTGYSPEISFTTKGLSIPIFRSISIDPPTQKSISVSSNFSDGGLSIIQKGLVWSTSPNPTVALPTKKYDAGSSTSYSYLNIKNLLPNTKYYIKAFAENSMGTGYSKEIVFTTQSFSTPTLFINNPSLSTTSVSISGSINNDGGSLITQKGFVWSTSPNPTIALNSKKFDGTSGSGDINVNISTLSPSTTYYIKGFATNSLGTGYTQEIVFTTLPISNLSINISDPYISSSTSIFLSGSLNNDGGSPITQKGFVWSTSPNPTIALNTKRFYSNSGNSIQANIEDLIPDTTYYVRGFATNSLGTVYSSEIEFTTLSLFDPTFTINNSSLSTNSAIMFGYVYNVDMYSVTQKGYVWSTSPNPTVSLGTKRVDTTSGNSISASITGLLPATTYYIRGFVTNTIGTAYSLEIEFTTLSLSTPSIDINNPSPAFTSVAISGSINDGGSQITQKGVVWSTSPNPIIALTTKKFDTTSGNSINVSITGLLPATTYYVRGFATNTLGTSYSLETAFTTKAFSAPSFSNLSTNTITQTSVNTYGSINDGGSTLSQKGFVWSTSPNPTVSIATKRFDTNPGNSINASITGLLPATTYYLRAFATNEIGTEYSIETTFTTLAFTVPSITSISTYNLYYNGVSASSYIDSNGGAAITQKGIVWSASPDPTIALTTKSIDTNSGNSINLGINGLFPATTYYLRAFAINSIGITYSNEVNLTTLAADAPSISSLTISSITQTSISASSSISSNGSAITQKGFVWSTNPNPTTALASKSIDPNNSIYTINTPITGLSPATTYYLRAFATNTQGTTYSLQTTFTTNP